MPNTSPETVQAALTFKADIERRFQQAAGLPDRRHYSALYSLPQRSPVLWINLNPAGKVEQHIILSDQELAAGKHEFFEGDGPTSKTTGDIVKALFPGPLIRAKSVQGTNLAWQRSPKSKDIDIKAAARITAPFLREYIAYVDPDVLIFGGCGTFDDFAELHGASLARPVREIQGHWGRTTARIFLSTAIVLDGRQREIIGLSHPSRGARQDALIAAKPLLADIMLPVALSYRDRA